MTWAGAYGTPNGIRTRVATLRGWCPRPLDDGGWVDGTAYPARRRVETGYRTPGPRRSAWSTGLRDGCALGRRVDRGAGDGGVRRRPEEAAELIDAAADDIGLLDALVARRLTGEPLAWITERTRFCGLDLRRPRGVRASVADRARGSPGARAPPPTRPRGRPVHGVRGDRRGARGRSSRGPGRGDRHRRPSGRLRPRQRRRRLHRRPVRRAAARRPAAGLGRPGRRGRPLRADAGPPPARPGHPGVRVASVVRRRPRRN